MNKLLKTLLMYVPLMLLILAVGAAVFFYIQYQNATENKAAKEVATITKELAKIMILPKNETPTIATIADKEKLKDQPFFKNAQNGDKVVVFTNSQKAIIYRPSTKQIVDVGPIQLNQPTGNAATEPAPSQAQQALRIAYLNGTTKTGLAATVEAAIQKQYPESITASKSTANKQNYTKTLIVDISGSNAPTVQAIARLLNGTVGTLPQGEVRPQADILVIAGGQ